MRRPLTGTTTAQDCQLTNSCVTPTPSNCDADGLCTPTPSPTPTPTPTPTPSSETFHFWQTSSWSGDQTCGQQTTVTRDVTCIEVAGDFPNFTFTPVDDSSCTQAKPPTTYSGTQAGCGGYSCQQVSADPWANDDPSANVECSDNSYRDVTTSCFDGDGNVVDNTVCDINTGDACGTSTYFGDYDNCPKPNYSWQPVVGNPTCQGADAYANVTYLCEADTSPGVSQAAYNCTDPMPTDGGSTVVGTCGLMFADHDDGAGSQRMRTIGHCDGNALIGTMDVTDKYQYPGTIAGAWNNYASPFCLQNNADCCEIREHPTGNGQGIYEAAAFSGPAVYSSFYGYTVDGQTYYGAYEVSDYKVWYFQSYLPQYQPN